MNKRWRDGKDGAHCGEMGEKVKLRGLHTVEQGGTRDLTVVRSRQTWGAYSTTRGHSDALALCASSPYVGLWSYCSWGLRQYPWPELHQRPCVYSWSGLSPETVRVSESFAVAGGDLI